MVLSDGSGTLDWDEFKVLAKQASKPEDVCITLVSWSWDGVSGVLSNRFPHPLQAAWRNMVVDYIPLAEMLKVSFEVVKVNQVLR